MLRTIRIGSWRCSFAAALITLAGWISGCDQGGQAVPPSSASCAGIRDLVLTNGQILTVDDNDSVAVTVRIRGDRILAVGGEAASADACVQTIDLGGRTVVPGLINVHSHYLRGAMRPGHDVRAIETAFSISEVQQAITERAATVPVAAGNLTGNDFITIVDAWNPSQFAEKRLPTRQELDMAAPRHPVFMMQYPAGPGATNSQGKAYLEANGITVADDGSIAGPPSPSATDAQSAYAVLIKDQTLDDRKRTLTELMQHSNTVGMSTILEGGGSFPGPGRFDEYHDYDAALALWRERALTVRIRAQIQAAVTVASGTAAIQARVDNMMAGFGDEMFRIAGFGENIVAETTPIQPLELFEQAFTIAATNGWLVHQHSVDAEELEMHTSAFERVNANTPIADLHWNLSHVQEIDDDILARLRRIGAGVAVQMHWYHGFFPMGDIGPPFRQILDSGVVVGAGSDAGAYSPWVWIYHMTTGNTSSGDPILADQRITRMEALRISTIGSAWFAQEEDHLGSIEPGKLADLVVLSDDYLTVADEDLRSLKSVLTLIGGAIVYSDGSVVACTSLPGSAWYRRNEDDTCEIQ